MPRRPAARDRGDAFLFYPRDFIEDPAVVRMSNAELGAYARLLCRAWNQVRAGVIEADEALLAHLAGCSPEEWERVRPAVSKAFRIGPETWTQKRMVETHAAQCRWHSGKVAGGRARARNSPRSASGAFTSQTPASHQQGDQQATSKGTSNGPTGYGYGYGTHPPPPAPLAFANANAPPAPARAGRDARRQVRELAKQLDTASPDFPTVRAWTWVRDVLGHPKPRDVMVLLGWLWKDGVHDLELAEELVGEALGPDVENPYAYLAKDGPARTCRTDQRLMERVERESARDKAEERAWLAGDEP